MSDDTRIQVLNEDGRSAGNHSALRIRRGDPPECPVVLVDYPASKSGATAYGLQSDYRGTLVSDGAINFNLAVNSINPRVALYTAYIAKPAVLGGRYRTPSLVRNCPSGRCVFLIGCREIAVR